MQGEFYPIKTNDNTISLYNTAVGDVYHSRVGAHTEALHKYVLPSGIIDFAGSHDNVSILDVCYGLGYNSKTAVSELLKANPDINIHVTALEIDPVVLALSSADGVFAGEIAACLDVKGVISDYIKNTAYRMPNLRQIIPREYELVSEDILGGFVHNIYYRSLSGRNIDIDFLIQDARFSVQSIERKYDFIFHDPFTPSKAPLLWTVEFFQQLYRLLNDYGNLTTYSSAAPVRSAMLEAEFFIGQTQPVGKKTTGTIAYKTAEMVKHHLSGKESGLLCTRAGVPYRDKYFSSTNEEILLGREQEMQSSGRVSSSSYLKSLNKLP